MVACSVDAAAQDAERAMRFAFPPVTGVSSPMGGLFGREPTRPCAPANVCATLAPALHTTFVSSWWRACAHHQTVQCLRLASSVAGCAFSDNRGCA